MDWRTNLLAAVPLPDPLVGGRNPIGWPGYEPRQAVRYGAGSIGGHDVVAVVWDFTMYGGSMGEVEAQTFRDAVRAAVDGHRPLVSLVRTGGTRLQEGVPALLGIACTSSALEELAAAGQPHISLADSPTTGGVWVSVVSGADLRAGVAGSTVGFSGPKVIEAMTGTHPDSGSHTAESAYAAGLLDAVLEPDRIADWLARTLDALRPHTSIPTAEDDAADLRVEERSGWQQVLHARRSNRLDGAALLDVVLDGAIDLHAADDTVRAAVGRSASDRRTIAVAVAARRGGRPTPAGYGLLTRAAQLADRIGADLLTLVDTPGADPRTPSEQAGIAPAIHTAMCAVLGCRSPSLTVVHGEGGSGGALAAAVTDGVLLTDTSYFTALAPEGAAVTLHLTPEEAADRMRITPPDLRRLGFADGYAPGDPAALRTMVATHLARLAGRDEPDRIGRRRARWSGPLPGRCDR